MFVIMYGTLINNKLLGQCGQQPLSYSLMFLDVTSTNNEVRKLYEFIHINQQLFFRMLEIKECIITA